MITLNNLTYVGLGKNVGLFRVYTNCMEIEFVLAVHKWPNIGYTVFNEELDCFEEVIIMADNDEPGFLKVVRQEDYEIDGEESLSWQIKAEDFHNWGR